MSKEKTDLNDFEVWLKTRFVDQVWISGHNFKVNEDSTLIIDGKPYTEREGKFLYYLLTSKNPLNAFKGKLIIWDRNGTLVNILKVITVIALIVVFIVVRR